MRRLEVDVFTLFPGWFDWLTEQRHVENVAGERLALRLHDVREHGIGAHRSVDDTPYGGGAGMLLRVDVMVASLEAELGAPLDEIRATRRVIALDPGGRQLDDALARDLAGAGSLVLLCGRYEGFDHRILDHVATEALSVGPYVLSGGELAAMVVIDAVARHLDGALGDERSAEEESFSPALDGDLEYPQYTRPEEFRGWGVPEVLRSGHHGRIAAWRRDQARHRTEASGRASGR